MLLRETSTRLIDDFFFFLCLSKEGAAVVLDAWIDLQLLRLILYNLIFISQNSISCTNEMIYVVSV